MSSNNGWIRIHRCILDNPICCKDAEYFSVWVYLLLNATHAGIEKIFKGKRITLQPGQLITGRKVIANTFGISESKVQRILKAFEIERQIERQSSNQNSLITIVNWYMYQSDERQSEQRMNNNRTASERPVNTLQECNNVNNDKNVINGESESAEKYHLEFEELWSIYPRKQGKQKAKEAFIQARIEGAAFEDIKKGIEAYKRHIAKNRIEQTYIKYGSTFFCNQSWLDDYGSDYDNEISKWGENLDSIL